MCLAIRVIRLHLKRRSSISLNGRRCRYVLLHKDLIKLRREDPVFRQQRRDAIDGAVLSSGAFLLRYFGGDNGDRLLLINLDRDLHCDPALNLCSRLRIIRAGSSCGRAKIPDTAATALILLKPKTTGGCLEIPQSSSDPN